jgi:hypothetical protein
MQEIAIGITHRMAKLDSQAGQAVVAPPVMVLGLRTKEELELRDKAILEELLE